MYIEIIYQGKTQPLTEALQSLLIPRKTRHFLRTRKDVWINGKNLPFHTEVHEGDTIGLNFEENDYPEHNVTPWNFPIEVMYEDEHLIVINKPIHLKTHPNEPTEYKTALNAVQYYMQSQGETQSPYVVHRLDKETSGLLLFAKNPIVLPLLTRQLEQKNMHRDYEALATGYLKHDLTIDKPIGRDRHDKRKRRIDANGQRAITHVTVLKHENKNTRIRCTLDTGRTHQIRVHLQSINHPLLGDPLYNVATSATRLYLHAYRLRFTHPFTFETIDINCKTPF